MWLAGHFSWLQPVRLAYQPPASQQYFSLRTKQPPATSLCASLLASWMDGLIYLIHFLLVKLKLKQCSLEVSNKEHPALHNYTPIYAMQVMSWLLQYSLRRTFDFCCDPCLCPCINFCAVMFCRAWFLQNLTCAYLAASCLWPSLSSSAPTIRN
jgi:hypothetical protein